MATGHDTLHAAGFERRPAKVTVVAAAPGRVGPTGPTGPPGPTGPGGGPGGGTYVHTQAAPAAVWAITHPLEKFPSVTVLDTAYRHLLTDIEYVDDAHLIVSFASPTSGKAVLN